METINMVCETQTMGNKHYSRGLCLTDRNLLPMGGKTLRTFYYFPDVTSKETVPWANPGLVASISTFPLGAFA